MRAQLAADIELGASPSLALAESTPEEYDLVERRLQIELKKAEQTGELKQSLFNELHALAASYCLARQYIKAERLYRLGLATREKVLGQAHSDVLDSLVKLAIVVNETGNKFEAKTLNFRIEILTTSVPCQEIGASKFVRLNLEEG